MASVTCENCNKTIHDVVKVCKGCNAIYCIDCQSEVNDKENNCNKCK